MSNDLYISETIANQIVSEFKAVVVDDIREQLQRLDAKLTDSDVILARRKALMDCLDILSERYWYKPYRFYGVPQVEERGLEELNKKGK